MVPGCKAGKDAGAVRVVDAGFTLLQWCPAVRPGRMADHRAPRLRSGRASMVPGCKAGKDVDLKQALLELVRSASMVPGCKAGKDGRLRAALPGWRVASMVPGCKAGKDVDMTNGRNRCRLLQWCPAVRPGRMEPADLARISALAASMVPGCKAGKDEVPRRRVRQQVAASMVPGCKAGKDGRRSTGPPTARARFNGARL